MGGPAIAWTSEVLPGDIVRVAFTGQGGIGSGGNPDSERMCAAVREVPTAHHLTGLVVDLSAFEYQYGDWIGAVPLAAVRAVGAGRVCVVASGETGTALGSLWDVLRLGQVVPLLASLEEALAHLSQPGQG